MTEKDCLAYALLLIFGIAFNAGIAYLEKRPNGHRGFTSFFVAVGVAVTIVSRVQRWGVEYVLDLLLAFIASGTPMIVGSVARYMEQRDRDAAIEKRNAVEALETIDA